MDAAEPFRLVNVDFETWCRNHKTDHGAHWCRALYPWGVFRQADWASSALGKEQHIELGGEFYKLTLREILEQKNGRIRYTVHIHGDPSNWVVRPWSDNFCVIAEKTGHFITLYAKDEDPSWRLVKDFLQGKFPEVLSAKSLPVARLLARAVFAELIALCLPPDVPMATEGRYDRHAIGAMRDFQHREDLYVLPDGRTVGYRYFSEDAYALARRLAEMSENVLVLYCVETKYQYVTSLPSGATVLSMRTFDADAIDGKFSQQILALQTEFQSLKPTLLPSKDLCTKINSALSERQAPPSDHHVNEALGRLHCPVRGPADLAYFLASANLVNAWIEHERKAGHAKRKKFYAFKQRVGEVLSAIIPKKPPDCEFARDSKYLYVALFGVVFSFTSIPLSPTSKAMVPYSEIPPPFWKEVRLKPIAPLVLEWGRACEAEATPVG